MISKIDIILFLIQAFQLFSFQLARDKVADQNWHASI